MLQIDASSNQTFLVSRRSRITWGLALALAAGVFCTQAEALRLVQTVALAGQTAPGTGGQTFTSFDEPMVNSAGQVAFVAAYTGGGAGVFLLKNGALSSVVVSGDSISGIGTVTLASISDIDGPAINNKGTVALVVRFISSRTYLSIMRRDVVGGPRGI